MSFSLRRSSSPDPTSLGAGERRRDTRRGQSLVEFALITPIVLMLLVVVADFGRIFAANLSIEAAARDAAEIGANEYLAHPPGPLDLPAPADPPYYSALHQRIARVVCAETNDLANSAFDPATGGCAGMPLIQACVHDSRDSECAVEAQGATIPGGCGDLATPPTNVHEGSRTPRWVEVRVCYRFTPVLGVPFLSFGEFWLQRSRTFVIPCYFALGTNECG